MGLLVTWLSQADQVPLEEGEHSFHVLALRWMLGLGKRLAAGELEPAAARDLARKFIDYLEANAEEYWNVPRLERLGGAEELPPPQAQDDEEALFGAAYEGVTYQDSTDDGVEGEVLGFEPVQEFELEHDGEHLQKRLRFLSTLSRLF